MNQNVIPEIWRSEGFAEDLFPEVDDGLGRREKWIGAVLGLVPVAMAAAGVMLAALTGGA